MKKFLCSILATMFILSNAILTGTAFDLSFWQATADGEWLVSCAGRIEQYKSDSTPQHLGIPATLTNPDDPEQRVSCVVLGGSLFKGNQELQTVKFNGGIQEIEPQCFRDCIKLQQITIPPELKEISTNCFSNCTSLNAVYFQNDGNLKVIGGSAFLNCKSLTVIQLPVELENIAQGSFGSCSNLTYVNIPNTVIQIGSSAFNGCNLKSIVIPESTKWVNGSAFANNVNLNRIFILNPKCSIGGNAFEFENQSSKTKRNGHRYIYGRKGSTAEQYAKQYGYQFVTIDGIEDVPAELLKENGSSDQSSQETVTPTETTNKPQQSIETANNTQQPTDQTQNRVQKMEQLQRSFSGHAMTVQNTLIEVLQKEQATPQYRGVLSDWAKQEVTAAIQLGIVPDTLQDYFAEPITRLGFSELAIKTIQKVCSLSDEELQTIASKQNAFSDCDDPHVLQAAALGIVSGYPDHSFLPYKQITRQEAAVMLERIASLLNGGLSNTEEASLHDIGNAWGKSSIQKVTRLKNPYSGKPVMNGIGSGEFDPNGYYTVEQAIMTMFRLTGSIVGKETNYQGAVVASQTPTPTQSPSSSLQDFTGYAPRHFSWKLTAYDAQNINSPYFKNGKWLRSDGMVVLYLDHESSPDCLEYELCSKANGSYTSYLSSGTAEVSQDNYAVSTMDGLTFQVKPDGSITLTTDWLDELYTDYGHIDGSFYLVKSK